MTDGSVGQGQRLSGPNYLIPDTLGTTFGTNLFHSFQEFSVSENQSATFTGPQTIINVISRVTGGDVSNIDGLLRSEVGQAGFFFINPSGIVFGPNATVDVPAAFHASTADELRFGDGAVFSAASPAISTLSTAQPTSFGFLSAQPASVELNGALLEFKPESHVSLSSGDITLRGPDAGLITRAGEIRLTAMGTHTGSVLMGEAPSDMAGGKLVLDTARIETSGSGGGHVVVHAGDVEMNDAAIMADNTGDDIATGGVDMHADSTLTVAHGSRVQSNVFGQADAGGIRVEADSLRIAQLENENFTGIFSEVEPDAGGDAGAIEIDVADVMHIQGAGGVSSYTLGAGDAGSIQVRAGDLSVDGEGRFEPYRTSEWIAGISSETDSDAGGNAGSVTIIVENTLSLLNGCGLASYANGTGNAGTVMVKAGDLKIDGGERGNFTYIASNASFETDSHTRAVEITVDNMLELINGAEIFSITSANTHAGDVAITAEALRIDGQGGASFTGIYSGADTGCAGDAGAVEITVSGRLELINGASISNSTYAEGHAGNLSVTAGELTIDGQRSGYLTGIASQANWGSTGNAGTVEITVSGQLELINGGLISSDTYAEGDAGNITVSAGALTIDDQGSEYFTGIASDANSGSGGNAGTVEITVSGQLDLINGAQISSSTAAKGHAGNITVSAGALTIDGQRSESLTGIASQANLDSAGNAGTVEITVSGLLELINGGLISSDTYAEGNGGNISVTAGELTIDDQGSEYFTGIASDANSGSGGDAGTVEITVSGLLELINGAQISSSSSAEGDAGNISVTAGGLTIDRQGSESLTGITSKANWGSEGHAGTVEITVSSLLELINGGLISSDTYAKGDAGNITVSAGAVTMDDQGSEYFTGIASDANSGSKGDAGTVEISVSGLLELINGAQISSSTAAEGDAGNITVTAGGLMIDRQGSESFTGIASKANWGSEGHAGTVEITVSGLLELINGGLISSDTYAEGDAGNITVSAEAVTMDAQGSEYFTGISSDANSGSKGDAGTVEISVSGLLELINGAQISSDTDAEGDAGNITVNAGSLTIDAQGSDSFTGIDSRASEGSEGHAGTVEITVSGLLELINGGLISSDTYAKGDAGNITVSAGAVTIDDQGCKYFTGVASDANSGSEGDAGTVEISVSGLLELINGAQITSGTYAEGDAGNITVTAGALTIDRQGGDSFTGIASQANWGSEGDAGTVEISVSGLLELLNGAEISSGTFGQGDAGNVTVTAELLTIDEKGSDSFTGISSQASPGSAGDAGTVEISVSGLLELLNGAEISTGTFAQGDAGNVTVAAGELRIDGRESDSFTGITSDANTGTEGNAGTVEISVSGLLELFNGAQISSSTAAEGNGGSVMVHAKELSIEDADTGIYSKANRFATGYVGDIVIDAESVNILNGGKISISADQTLSDDRLAGLTQNSINIHTWDLHLDQNSEITAESSENVPAGAINIKANRAHIENSSGMITSSNEADGGGIFIQGDSLVLKDSFITTSVEGSSGDGGDIGIGGISGENTSVAADVLVLDNGFIQANTGADQASGGNIDINVQALIINGNTELMVGSEERLTFQPGQNINVIQAAAPGGEQGTITITAPEVDISSTIINTVTNFINPAQLGTNPCLATNGDASNTLVQGGRGGIPEAPEDMSALSYIGKRLDQFLNEEN